MTFYRTAQLINERRWRPVQQVACSDGRCLTVDTQRVLLVGCCCVRLVPVVLRTCVLQAVPLTDKYANVQQLDFSCIGVDLTVHTSVRLAKVHPSHWRRCAPSSPRRCSWIHMCLAHTASRFPITRNAVVRIMLGMPRIRVHAVPRVDIFTGS